MFQMYLYIILLKGETSSIQRLIKYTVLWNINATYDTSNAPVIWIFN